MINLRHKSFNKRSLGFVDEIITPTSHKTIFVKFYEEQPPKKTYSKLKFHCIHFDKMRHTINRYYTNTFDNFQRKMTNPING